MAAIHAQPASADLLSNDVRPSGVTHLFAPAVTVGHSATGLAQTSMLAELLTSGASIGAASIATNPLDVLKVRLQLDRTNGLTRAGMASTGLSVIRNEGVSALFSGWGPTIARGFFFGGARLGLYTPIKALICGDEKPTLLQKVLSATVSGGLAGVATSPTELVKTRLQAVGNTPGAVTSTAGVIRGVVAADGVLGLWKGASPGLVRACILTASQCATYDEVKCSVSSASGLHINHAGVHFASSMIAGLVTTTMTNPVDVIKTRMFMGGGRYRGPLDCAADVLAKEGPAGFMKGWAASYMRLGPFTVIMFLAAEKLRALAGLNSL